MRLPLDDKGSRQGPFVHGREKKFFMRSDIQCLVPERPSVSHSLACSNPQSRRYLFIFSFEGNLITGPLLLQPCHQPRSIPSTLPRTILIRLPRATQSYTSPNGTSLRVVRVLEAIFVIVAKARTFVKRSSLGKHTASPSEITCF